MLATILKVFAPLGSKAIKGFFKSKDLKERTAAEWETEAMKASKGSWKDEWWTFWLAQPFIFFSVGAYIMAFNEGDWAKAGDWLVDKFVDVMSYESWYGVTLNAIILASFGIRAHAARKKAKAATEIAKAKHYEGDVTER